MATYPIKMLRDENQEPFVPMVSADSIYTNDGRTFEENFASKLEASDLKEGTGIILEQNGNSTTISVDFGATDNIIDNLNTTVPGQGPLDARQGNILKNMIPTIVDNLTTADPNKVLSANQGKMINDRLDSLDTRANSSVQCFATVFADGTSNKLELTNLNLQPGSLYEIVYAEWSTENTTQGHVMRLNGITSGYQGVHAHPAGMTWGDSGNTLRIMYHTNCLAYVNGWGLGRDLAYGSYMLYYFNHDWITVTGQSHIVPHPEDMVDNKMDGKWNMIWEQGNYNGHDVQTINSISIETLDSSKIGSGSYLKIYGR